MSIAPLGNPATAFLDIHDESSSTPCLAEAKLLVVDNSETPKTAELEIKDDSSGTVTTVQMTFSTTEPGPVAGQTFHVYTHSLSGLVGPHSFKVTFTYEFREERTESAADSGTLNCGPPPPPAPPMPGGGDGLGGP